MQKIIILKLKILNYFCNPKQLSAPSLHFFSVLTTKTYQNKSNFASTSRRHQTGLTKILQYGIFGKIFFLNVFQTTFYQIVMFKFQFTKLKNLQEMSSSGGALFISDTNLTLKRGADPTRRDRGPSLETTMDSSSEFCAVRTTHTTTLYVVRFSEADFFRCFIVE